MINWRMIWWKTSRNWMIKKNPSILALKKSGCYSLLRGNPAQKEKKSDLLSFSFIFYFSHFTFFCHSLIFLFFYFNIEDNVMFKVWGYWEIFCFLCCVKKYYIYVWSFWTPIGLWEYEYYVWELVEIDEDTNRMNEDACKF